MQTSECFRKKLRLQFEGSLKKDCNIYEKDIHKLVNNMILLEEYNLSDMNDMLLTQNKRTKFIERITEINFTAGLLKSNKSIIKENVGYEREIKPGNNRRIDLDIFIDPTKYLIQIKCLSTGERENRQNNIITDIKWRAANLSLKKFFDVRFSDNFFEINGTDTDKFFKFIEEKAKLDVDSVVYNFSGNNGSQATVEFYLPESETLEHLTLGSCGDLRKNEVTGETQTQIRNALENTAEAFYDDISSEIINLVVMEIPRPRLVDIDFCDAIFGSEKHVENFLGNARKSRDNDGFFNSDKFRLKIAGVIGLIKKEENSMCSDYHHVFLVNPCFKEQSSTVECLIPNVKIISRDSYVEDGFGFNN